jgi:hypothetical protein
MANTSFKQFCRRKWLDYCDENNTRQSKHLEEKEYTQLYWLWLLDKYEELKEQENESAK